MTSKIAQEQWPEEILKIIPEGIHNLKTECSRASWALRYFYREIYLKRYHHSPLEVQKELESFIEKCHGETLS